MPYVYLPDPPPPIAPRYSYDQMEYDPYQRRRAANDPLDFVKAMDRYNEMKEAKQARKEADKKKKEDEKKKSDGKKMDWKPLQPILFMSMFPLGYITINMCVALSHALQDLVK